MKRVCAVAALLAAAVVLTGQNPLDYVRATNCGGYETGFFVWGKIPGASLPTKATGGCGVDVSVGSVEKAAKGNQLATFTKGQAPKVIPKVDWNSSATHVVNLSSPVKVKVKFWLLYRPESCDLDCARKLASGFLAWSNALLSRERAGIVLVAADPTAIVTDETPSTDASVQAVVADFRDVSETGHCTDQKLGELKNALHQDNVLNVYLVKTVGARTDRGTVCKTPPPVLDTALIAHQASYGTLLHEIGHLFGLQHADYINGVSQDNVMISSSASRNYLTEGQVFWMQFADRSVLPAKLPGGQKSAMRNCYGNPTEAKPCPAWKECIWQDP